MKQICDQCQRVLDRCILCRTLTISVNPPCNPLTHRCTCFPIMIGNRPTVIKPARKVFRSSAVDEDEDSKLVINAIFTQTSTEVPASFQPSLPKPTRARQPSVQDPATPPGRREKRKVPSPGTRPLAGSPSLLPERGCHTN